MLLVLWTIGISTLLLVSLQMSSFRQASIGREALGRVRAKWAARAGVENCIAYLAWELENSEGLTPQELATDLEELAIGETVQAAYRVSHLEEGEEYLGPLDAHAKIGINTMTFESMLLLEDMTEEVANSILDWIDADDEEREGGAEANTYQNMFPSYEPRNGPVRSLEELELVYGVEPELLRGEDWNLNGALDPNEKDGDTSFPDDNEDEFMDGGWSDIITAHSRGSTVGRSGEPRIDLAATDPATVSERLGVDTTQADALIAYAGVQGNPIPNLLLVPLSSIGPNGTPAGQPKITNRDLTDDQFRALFDEVVLATSEAGNTPPGKLNVNTATREVLEYLPGMDTGLADDIARTRDGMSGGFENIMDLLSVPGIDEQALTGLVNMVDVRSNVYIISSRGLARSGRTEVELVVTIDRSELPIKILDYIER